jgi:hypothetical protein
MVRALWGQASRKAIDATSVCMCVVQAHQPSPDGSVHPERYPRRSRPSHRQLRPPASARCVRARAVTAPHGHTAHRATDATSARSRLQFECANPHLLVLCTKHDSPADLADHTASASRLQTRDDIEIRDHTVRTPRGQTSHQATSAISAHSHMQFEHTKRHLLHLHSRCSMLQHQW